MVWQPQMCVRQGESIVTVRVTSNSTSGANSEAISNGHLGVDVASNGRVSPVDVFEDAQSSKTSKTSESLTQDSKT